MTHSEQSEIAAEVWAVLRENGKLLVENRHQLELLREESKETDRRFRENEAKLNKAFQETDRRFRETDEQLRENDEKLMKAFQETDRRFRETDEKINKMYGLFADQWGRLVEALVKADVVRLFQNRGINIVGVTPRLQRERDGDTLELDLVLLNTTEIVLIEVKSRFTQALVVEFLEDLNQFLQFFPEYRTYRIYGGIAGLDIPVDVGRWAYRQGLFVLSITGEGLATIKNDDRFKPKNFGTIAQN